MLPQDAQLGLQRLQKLWKVGAKIGKILMIEFEHDFYRFFIEFSIKKVVIFDDLFLIFLLATHRLMKKRKKARHAFHIVFYESKCMWELTRAKQKSSKISKKIVAKAHKIGV